MPFDFDRIIDHQLYLATQQCIQPHVQQQRRVSSAPTVTTTAAAAAAGPSRTVGARKSSLGSLISPWTTSSGGSNNSSSGGGRKYSSLYQHHRPRPSAQQGYSPVDLFFTAPVGVQARGGRELYGRGGRTPAQPSREDSSSSLDQFVTAPIGDFTTTAGAAAAHVPLPPSQQQHSNGSRPGSSDTDDWTFETASAGSGSGTFSGLETTVDLTPSPPPSRQPGKLASYTSAAAAVPPQSSPEPSLANQQRVNGVTAVTLQVQDLQRTKRFYERVFGVPCTFPEEDGTSAVLSLNGGALVVTLRETSSPGEQQRGDRIAVPVDDVGEVCRRLRGLAEEGERVGGPWFAEPAAGPGPARVVEFCDPAGHLWRVGKGVEGS